MVNLMKPVKNIIRKYIFQFNKYYHSVQISHVITQPFKRFFL